VRVRGQPLLLAALALCNLSVLPKQPALQPPSRFVQRAGERLLRHNQDFRFVGVNCYRLAERVEERDDILQTLAAHGVKVVRFWAFQKHCGPTGLDFRRFDLLLEAAKQHDVLLLPVLENHWGACTYGPEIKGREWYESGWRTDRHGPRPYLEYIRALAAHWRDEPQVLAWQLVNEPEVYPDTKENYAVLRKFATDAAGEVKRMDPNHLVSLGLLGLGQPATAEKRFRSLHDTVQIDLVSAHDHGYIFEPMPGRDAPRPANSFYADLLAARWLRKPFLATESCVPLPWVGGNSHKRVELFRAKLDAFFAGGGDGYILWNYEPEIESECGFDEDDPVLALLKEFASDLQQMP